MSAQQATVSFQQLKLGINLIEQNIAGRASVVVSFVFPSSEADAAGVQVGDVVLDIAGVSMQTGAQGLKDRAVDTFFHKKHVSFQKMSKS